MQIRHWKQLSAPQTQPRPLTAACWSPNGMKLATCGLAQNVISVYDEQGDRKDKFATKSSSNESKDYSILHLTFSPDSNRLAVAQSDGGLFVYKLGLDWGEKKTICNKFILAATSIRITVLIWPRTLQNHLIFAGTDGKVRLGNLKSNKATVIGEHSCPAISAATSLDGSCTLIGFSDGMVQKYQINEDGSDVQVTKFVHHACPPTVIAYGSSILIAGNDRIVVVYDEQGRVQQKLDYSRDEDMQEFTVGQVSSNGQTVLIGSTDRIHVFTFGARAQAWKEAAVKHIENYYSVTALAWRSDGSKLLAGSLSGCADLFECCLKRMRYQGKYDLNYLSTSQVVIKNLSNGQRVLLKSKQDQDIEKINIYKDQFVIAITPETLIVADMSSNRLSEVPWLGGGHEKFNFDYPNICIVFNAGELSLIEYGNHQIIGSCRTEYMSSHLISIRIHAGKNPRKMIAYLADPNTIHIMDLISGMVLANVTHDFKIDWLELSMKGDKLLFRDKRQQLILHDTESRKNYTLLSYCSFVQWVENSDVIVAQNRQQLCVWYSLNSPDNATIIPIKGDVEKVETKNFKTTVTIDEGSSRSTISLDQGMIEFNSSMEEKDYGRTVELLESLSPSAETDSLWKALGQAALEDRKLLIAERCFAATGDLPSVTYLRKIREMAEKLEKEIPMLQNGIEHFSVRAKLAILDRQFKLAENIYLEQGMVDDAMEMYQQLHKWDLSIKVAEARNHPDLETLKHNYFNWLVNSGQEDKAAQMKEEEGDYVAAINLYIKGNMPSRAALALQQYGLQSRSDLSEKIAAALSKASLHEKAGDLFLKLGQSQRALESYKNGKAFHQAVDVARRHFPHEVVSLELQWAEHLVNSRQLEAAVNHFIEAGNTQRAIQVAAEGQMWKRIASIVDSMGASKEAEPYYIQLAHHYDTAGNVEQAEKFYLLAGKHSEAINMYSRAKKWEHAHRIAAKSMDEKQLNDWIMKQAKDMEGEGKLKDAEKLYLAINDPDLAISMYKSFKQYDQMVRLVSTYHKDLLKETHEFLAKTLEAEMRFREAESHFIEAGDWKGCINMYCSNNQFEEAHRVAKVHGGTAASKQVAYIWAKFLGGDAAVKLLNKFGLLESAVEFAAENGHFDFAFELARVADKSVLQIVYYKQAVFFEDAGRFQEAEASFIQAGKPKEAILMYIHQEDWDSAFKIAEAHEPGSVNDILLGQAKAAFSKKDFGKAETLILRAQKPELMIKLYKDNNLWKEALQFASEYLPAKVAEVHADYDRFVASQQQAQGADQNDRRTSNGDSLSLARNFERQKDFSSAIDSYLRLDSSTTNQEQLENAWSRAIELCQKFVPAKLQETVLMIASRLMKLKQFKKAGNLYASIDSRKNAVEAFVAGEFWQEARFHARQDATLSEFVENSYVKFMKANAKAEVPVETNVNTALDIFAQRGDWHKCLESASTNTAMFSRYAKFALQNLLKDEKYETAARLFAQHGVVADPMLYSGYDQIARHVLLTGNNESYGALREMLFKLTSQDPATSQFEKYLFITHLMALKEYCSKKKEMQGFAARQAISLLRYTDILPPLKTYYEAGSLAKNAGLLNMAFVCWNRFLDLTEAVEDGLKNASSVENSDFANTDVPYDFVLPAENFPEAKREEARDWVLSMSLDQKVQQDIEIRSCEICSASVFSGSLICFGCRAKLEPCIVTGFPVLKNRVSCTVCKKNANKDDWNKFVMSEKVCPWCGSQQTPNYSSR